MATNLKTIRNCVRKTPSVCGGRACIRNTRITVWGLVNSRRLGAADEQILKNIVGLTPKDLQAAWDYYREHPAEIEKDIRDNEGPTFPPRTELGRRLWSIRQRILECGQPLLDWDGIEHAVREGRGQATEKA